MQTTQRPVRKKKKFLLEKNGKYSSIFFLQ